MNEYFFFNYSLPTSKTSINSSPFKIYNDKINDINDDNKNSIIIENMNDDKQIQAEDEDEISGMCFL